MAVPRRRILPAVGSVLLVIGTVACIGSSRRQDCSSHEDCKDGFCNGRGFCDYECRDARDCPCGSFCARSCNLCVRDDRTGPATCFAFRHGLNTAEVLGACRADVDGSPPAATASAVKDATGEDAGTCALPPPTLPACLNSPPESMPDAGKLDVDGAVTDANDAGDGGDR